LPRIITGKINASARIIADISSGIYRTPANALKELVSNAWDADAPEVVINTGYPRFDLVTCSDTGLGMTTNEFRKYMRHIGGSFKRIGGDTTPSGRPIIGKIGIGILAIAQICDRFGSVSKLLFAWF
jgi:HSP90 family molecular chaperone